MAHATIARENGHFVEARAMQSLVTAMHFALVVGFGDSRARQCARRLEAAGYVVLRVAHGLAAQEECARMKPSVIVMSRDLFSMEKRAVTDAAWIVGAWVVEENDLETVLFSAAS
jgi:hypothetical protein